MFDESFAQVECEQWQEVCALLQPSAPTQVDFDPELGQQMVDFAWEMVILPVRWPLRLAASLASQVAPEEYHDSLELRRVEMMASEPRKVSDDYASLRLALGYS